VNGARVKNKASSDILPQRHSKHVTFRVFWSTTHMRVIFLVPRPWFSTLH